ncbi:hypothetical protein E3P99_02813 [Wallemia hederae]|uniref:USP domain-containing protein n=1 Tax=Wallemia hederae TaxID=1540922 RepID=A0A4T0FI12_9BASI|nr:hypothetical protein E3P99_02813 [Wallemia hederae]
MTQCGHMDAHLRSKEAVHRVAVALNWGLSLSRGSRLCLTCAATLHYAALDQHPHCFAMDLLSGSVHCNLCRDYIYSPHLDRILRLLKLRREEKATKSRCKAVFGGPRGFRNLGKTCFLNVVLQAFIANPLLRSYFLSEKHNHALCTRERCTACELDKLFMQVHQPDIAPLGPTSLLHNLWTAPGASDLAGYAQQDAHEAYISLLNLVHAGCTDHAHPLNEPCTCIIHSTFQGTLQSELRCGKCGYASITSDPFLDVSLDVGSSGVQGVGVGGGGVGASAPPPANGSSSGMNGAGTVKNGANMAKNGANNLKNGASSAASTSKNNPPSLAPQTLDNCLRRYTHAEHSDWKCTRCSAADASTKQLSFRKLPTVLAFQIKRYEHGLWAQKLDAPVRFPLTLDMRHYTSSREGAEGKDGAEGASHTQEPDEMHLYDLFCVINHLGEMETGHYTCASRFGEQWFRCEDADVTPTNIKSVLDSQGYMLLYIKRTLVYYASS